MSTQSKCTFRGVERENPFTLRLACTNASAAAFLLGKLIDGEFLIMSSVSSPFKGGVPLIYVEVKHVGQLDTQLYPPVEIEMLSDHDGVFRS